MKFIWYLVCVPQEEDTWFKRAIDIHNISHTSICNVQLTEEQLKKLRVKNG